MTHETNTTCECGHGMYVHGESPSGTGMCAGSADCPCTSFTPKDGGEPYQHVKSDNWNNAAQKFGRLEPQNIDTKDGGEVELLGCPVCKHAAHKQGKCMHDVGDNHEGRWCHCPGSDIEAEREALIQALKKLDNILTVPAAEYVPAIRDAFEVIDATKRELGLSWAFSLKEKPE